MPEPPVVERRLMLAAPLYGGLLHFGFHRSVCDLMIECAKRKILFGQKYVHNDSLVQRARNRLVAFFLESSSTDLLFVDSDIQFSATDALSLLERPEPIIGGIYSRKQIDWGRIHRAARSGIPPESLPPFGTCPVLNWLGPVTDVKLDTPFEVKHIGTGFLRIRREVFERMIKYYGDRIGFDYSGDEPVFKGKRGYDFFYSGIWGQAPLGSGGRQYLSEDWGFSERAKQCGYKIYAAPWIRLTHIGYHEFPSDLAALDEPETESDEAQVTHFTMDASEAQVMP